MDIPQEKLSLGDVQIEEKTFSADSSLETSSVSSVEQEGTHNSPIVIILVGMAGSGKTTLTQRLTAHLLARKSAPYTVNLDPACREPPFPVNIDIRDTVDYKKVMKQYNLGPNGAIVTSLNLFATKFDQVLDILKQRSKTHKYILIDTPGQIEVFMWSASGNIITECLAALFPTVMIFVTDLVTNAKPITFISNMSYACSILYKTKLPLVITLNKCDQIDPTYAKEWIQDNEAFEAALASQPDYSSTLASSLALVLDDFYRHIQHTVVSAYDGYGMEDFFAAVDKAVTNYETEYKPMYEALVQERKTKSTKVKKKVTAARESGEPSCFSVRGSSDGGGAGLSLRLDDGDEDDSSSSDDEPNAAEANEEGTFNQLYQSMAKQRTAKSKEADTSN